MIYTDDAAQKIIVAASVEKTGIGQQYNNYYTTVLPLYVRIRV